jgi:predicted nicotinamide N-methyase
MSQISVRGKVVLVTGAGSGLGAATARAFATARESPASKCAPNGRGRFTMNYL